MEEKAETVSTGGTKRNDDDWSLRHTGISDQNFYSSFICADTGFI